MKQSSERNERDLFTAIASVSTPKTWYRSLAVQVREFMTGSQHLAPPIAITAAPVDVVEIWTRKEGHLPGLLSLLGHVIVVTAWIVLSVISTHRPLPPVSVGEQPVLLEPLVSMSAVAISAGGGGGGGVRAATPASRGMLPKASEIQFVPPTPLISKAAPELAAEPTFIAPQLAGLLPVIDPLRLGDPTGVIGLPSAGEGQGGGIGDKGNGHGDGPGIGPGAGPGSNGGKGGPNGIVRIGAGGASPPSCPIPSSLPAYTDAARRAQIQGTVALDVIVNRDGTVSVSGIAQRIGYGLDDEASQFVARTFRCQPGTYQGESVATPARIDVNFHLY